MPVVIAFVAHSANPQLPTADLRATIAQAQHIVTASGDAVWPGLSKTRLRVQVIAPAGETLFCSKPLPGFVAAGRDPVTGCSVQTRGRTLPLDLAGADEQDGVPVIHMGLPAALDMSRAEWIVTLLHEGFHQRQSDTPGYAAAVLGVRRALGQSGGQWALTYPFPYPRQDMAAAMVGMCRAAHAFLAAKPGEDIRPLVARYWIARRAARAAAGETTWRYYQFQVGQEGVARWAELKLARRAGLADRDIAAVAADRWAGLANSLQAIEDQGPGMWKRSSLYVFGAIEAEMLHRLSPTWQQAYRRDPFSLGRQLDALDLATM